MKLFRKATIFVFFLAGVLLVQFLRKENTLKSIPPVKTSALENVSQTRINKDQEAYLLKLQFLACKAHE